MILSSHRFFFFQAEDGIRDGHVTGVQTCALPIFSALRSAGTQEPPPAASADDGAADDPEAHLLEERSEERRVGKECRSRWWAEHEEKGEVTDDSTGWRKEGRRVGHA